MKTDWEGIALIAFLALIVVTSIIADAYTKTHGG